MLSLGVSKGGVIPPTDEDRRRIIKQMKVRTTLKGDKSWIHHHNSDSEDEKKSSPLSGQAGGGSPASKPSTPQSNRSPASKPQSGYLIRGVFTRTIDKTSSAPDSSSNEAQKSCSSTPRGPSSGRSSSGYRMTTEDYKKLAPYNVKQKSVDLDEEDVPFTPDEHKKRTEAANSVLRRTASRERAYVLSAAKKSNGSPTQEFPPMFAKRIEIEEEEGQQRRSSTVSGSCRLTPDDNSTNGLRKTAAGSSWNEPKPTAASPSGKSQTTTALSETSERIPTAAEIRNGENRQASTGKSSPEAASQHGDGDKPPKELPEPFPRDELAPRTTVVATNGSYPAHTEANSGFYSPKSHSGCRDRPTDATDKLHLPYETSHCLDDVKPEPARSSLQSDVTSPTERAPVHLEDTEYSFKRLLDSTNHTEKGQEPPDHSVHPEPPRLKDHNEHEPSMTRSSSLPRESSITAPETQRAEESDPCQESKVTPAYEEQTCPTTESHPESPGDWRHNEPSPVAPRSNFSSQESALGAYEAQHPVPLYPDRQPFSVPAPSHRIPAYVDSQVFSSRRAAPDYEGSRYDSTGAWGHCDFNPAAERHDSLPRDTTVSVSPRSHRVPFYMDTLNCNSTRLLSSSSERICGHSSPAASGYQSDSSAAGRGVLFLKEYVNTGGFSASPRYGSGSLVDLTDVERATYGHHSYLSSAPLHRSSEPLCSYCSREIRDCPKIIIEHLNIHCHEYCFRCGICHKAMGDLLDKIFIHRDIVHCDKCYEKLF